MHLRKDVKSYLHHVNLREDALQLLQSAVNNVHDEKFFVDESTKELEEQRTDAFGRKVVVQFQDDNRNQIEEQRNEMLKMANNLVTLTENVLKHSKAFFKSFNKRFFFIRLD